MIEYENQFKMIFSIGEYNDFLREENLFLLKLNERVGCVLPEFEIQFKISNSNLFKVLNETNELKLSMGVKEIQIDVPLKIYKKHVETNSEGNYTITAQGLLSNSAFLFSPQSRTFGNATSNGQAISGLEIIGAIAKENFQTIDANIENSQDYMLRIQPGISNKQAIEEIWHTLYTPETFITMGITSQGKFKIRDIRQLVGTEPNWNFTFQPKNVSKDIEPKGNAILDDESGINNYLFGYIRQQEFWDEDSGDQYVSQTGNATLFSLASSFNRDNIVMQNPQVARNENMYTEYWEAYMTNLSNLALFSSVTYQLQFQPWWYPVEILDLAMLNVEDPKGVSEEAFSGLYTISAVSRVFKKRKITTVVGLNREGFNKIL